MRIALVTLLVALGCGSPAVHLSPAPPAPTPIRPRPVPVTPPAPRPVRLVDLAPLLTPSQTLHFLRRTDAGLACSHWQVESAQTPEVLGRLWWPDTQISLDFQVADAALTFSNPRRRFEGRVSSAFCSGVLRVARLDGGNVYVQQGDSEAALFGTNDGCEAARVSQGAQPLALGTCDTAIARLVAPAPAEAEPPSEPTDPQRAVDGPPSGPGIPRFVRLMTRGGRVYWLIARSAEALPVCEAWRVRPPRGQRQVVGQITRRERGADRVTRHHAYRYDYERETGLLTLLGHSIRTVRRRQEPTLAEVGCEARLSVRADSRARVLVGGQSWYLSRAACQQARRRGNAAADIRPSCGAAPAAEPSRGPEPTPDATDARAAPVPSDDAPE